MDLLTGYGSDLSDDEAERNPGSVSGDAVPQGPRSAMLASEGNGQPQRQTPSGANVAPLTENNASKNGGSSGIWSQLPPPTSGVPVSVPSTSGLSGLPPPKGADTRGGGARKVVTMQFPFRKELLAAALDSDDEDEPAAKRVKTTGAKSRLMDFLPPPKHDRGPVRALGEGSGGADLCAGTRPAKGAAEGTVSDARASGARAAVPGSTKLPANFFTGEVDVYDNEAYRIREGNDGDSGAAGAALGAYNESSGGPHGFAPYGAAHGPAAYFGHDYGPGAAAGGPSGGRGAAGGGTAAEPEDLLEQALRAEQERASKRGGGVKLVEISAQDLTRMDPAAREAAKSARDALGSEYAMSLRRTAAPFEGSKMARRKHQIGTLLFNARMQELDQLEKKTQGQKSKAETAAKYGW